MYNGKVFIIYGVLFITLFACRAEEKAPEIPIPHEKLVPVLADAYIAEAAINSLVGEVKDSMAGVYYDQISEIHGITRTDFDSTLSIMQTHPGFMDSIYANVLKHLTELDKGKAEKKLHSDLDK